MNHPTEVGRESVKLLEQIARHYVQDCGGQYDDHNNYTCGCVDKLVQFAMTAYHDGEVARQESDAKIAENYLKCKDEVMVGTAAMIAQAIRTTYV